MPCTASAKSLRRARPVRRAVRDSARWARFNSIPDVSHRALIAGASSAVLAIGLVGCGSSSSSSVDTTNGPFALPPEAGHVHGIAPRPAGGIVVGTHGGLYAAGSDGALARVGDPADYMGLAALPPAALLSSGHPGPESDEPNPLGLRRSDDGGATWTRIDSVPRDDYHVIEAGGGRVYAVGSDGATYAGAAPTALVKVGQAPEGLIDLAAHPTRGTSVVATTQSGMRRSGDGGRTWAAASDRIGLVSWASPAALFMVDATGGVSMSGDGGASWSARGSIDAPPAALLATSASDLVAADHEGRIRTSDDGGRTWS